MFIRRIGEIIQTEDYGLELKVISMTPFSHTSDRGQHNVGVFNVEFELCGGIVKGIAKFPHAEWTIPNVHALSLLDIGMHYYGHCSVERLPSHLKPLVARAKKGALLSKVEGVGWNHPFYSTYHNADSIRRIEEVYKLLFSSGVVVADIQYLVDQKGKVGFIDYDGVWYKHPSSWEQRDYGTCRHLLNHEYRSLTEAVGSRLSNEINRFRDTMEQFLIQHEKGSY